MTYDLRDAFTRDIFNPTWVIEDYLPASTIMLIAGDAGVGKSSFNLAEGLHVALGRPFCGLVTHQTRVLYFDQENSHADLTGYLQQLWMGIGCPTIEDVQPWFRVEHFQLGHADWPVRMAAILNDWKPGLVYIDTANAAFNIPEENDNAAAQIACQRLRLAVSQSASKPAVKLIKHAKYQSGGDHKGSTRRTIRGAKAWLGAVDQTAYHIRNTSGRPPKHGLKPTIIVPDKSRAYGLARNIAITPSYTDTTPKGLIIQGNLFDSPRDLMVIAGDE